MGFVSGMSGIGFPGGAAGRVIPIIDKMNLAFGSLGPVDINLAQNVDTSDWVAGDLVTRAYSTATFDGTANVYVVNSYVGADDPATLFSTPVRVASDSFVARSADITSSNMTAGQVDIQPLSSLPIGSSLRVFVEYNAGTTAGNVTIGVSLVARRRTPYLPQTLYGLSAWYRADLGVRSGGQFAWNDQSRTGDSQKNASSSGTARPTLNTSNAAYNGCPTIDFNGTTNYLQTATWTNPVNQPFTEFVVGHAGVGTSSSIALSNLGSGLDCNIFEATSDAPSIAAGGVTVASTGIWVAPGVFCSVFNGASSTVYFNSRTSTGSGSAGTNGRTGLTIGDYGPNLQNGFSWGNHGGGSIAEIINYNRILTGYEIAQVMTYLGARYGISIA